MKKIFLLFLIFSTNLASSYEPSYNIIDLESHIVDFNPKIEKDLDIYSFYEKEKVDDLFFPIIEGEFDPRDHFLFLNTQIEIYKEDCKLDFDTFCLLRGKFDNLENHPPYDEWKTQEENKRDLLAYYENRNIESLTLKIPLHLELCSSLKTNLDTYDSSKRRYTTPISYEFEYELTKSGHAILGGACYSVENERFIMDVSLNLGDDLSSRLPKHFSPEGIFNIRNPNGFYCDQETPGERAFKKLIAWDEEGEKKPIIIAKESSNEFKVYFWGSERSSHRDIKEARRRAKVLYEILDEDEDNFNGSIEEYLEEPVQIFCFDAKEFGADSMVYFSLEQRRKIHTQLFEPDKNLSERNRLKALFEDDFPGNIKNKSWFYDSELHVLMPSGKNNAIWARLETDFDRELVKNNFQKYRAYAIVTVLFDADFKIDPTDRRIRLLELESIKNIPNYGALLTNDFLNGSTNILSHTYFGFFKGYELHLNNNVIKCSYINLKGDEPVTNECLK